MKKQIFIIVAIIVFVLLILMLRQCQTSNSNTGRYSPKDSVEMLSATIKTIALYSDTIGKSYQAHDYIAHAKLTARTMQIFNRLPSDIHIKSAAPLIKAIRKHGLAAYTSIIADYTYRLSRYPTRARKAALQTLRKEIVGEFKTIDVRRQGFVLIRTDAKGSLRVYSENVGRAVAAFAMTEEGYEMIASGATTEDLVRTLAMAAICREQTEDGQMQSAEGFRRCIELGDIVAGALTEMGIAPATADQMVGSIRGGISRGVQNCLEDEANATSAEMIAEMEEFISCMEQQIAGVRNGSQLTPSGYLMSGEVGTSGFGHLIDEMLSGFTHTGSTMDEIPEGMQFTHNFENPTTGETITVVEYSITTGESWATSSTETGTLVSHTGEAGTNTSLFGSNGNPVESYFEGAGSYEGISTHSTYHSNGNINTKTTRNDNTGETTVEKFDEEGNKISEETAVDPPEEGTTETPSTPIGEEGNFPCGRDIRAEMMEEEMEASGSALDSYIIPDPNGAVRGRMSDCLDAALSQPAATCGPSVAMCISPVYQNLACACGSSTEIPDIPILNPNCQAINCGPDGECNPTTGTCQTDGDIGDVPEIWPPVVDLNIPEINTPPIIEPPFDPPD